MQTIGFIGLGHMGAPMAKNLLQKGKRVIGFDLSESAKKSFELAGGTLASSLKALAKDADVVITMLPASEHVCLTFLGDEGIFNYAKPGSLLIDCSSIDVATTKELAKEAKAHDLKMIDAPVSGGMAGAKAGTLTFMVGGEKADFELAKPLLELMGKNIFHAGDHGHGQAAKICNNMLLGISMIGVCEAFNLAHQLGLSTQSFFDICAVSSGQCWSLTSYCPAPGPVPSAPSNHDYQPGFSAAMMLKDLKLSQNEAKENKVNTPMGALATTLYANFNSQGHSNMDFSAIIDEI